MNRYLLLAPFRAVRVSRALLTRKSPLQSQVMLRDTRNASSVATNAEASKVSIPGRIKRFLDENPFTQIALLVCVLVVGVASLVEWTQNKRRTAKFGNRALFPSLPPTPHHPVFALEEEVALIAEQLPGLRFSSSRAVSIVGGRGAGKTELARQVAEALMQREKRLYRSDVHVLTLDFSSKDGLLKSLLRSAALLQIPQSQMSNAMSGDKIAEILSALNQRLKRKQVVCIIENATSQSVQENAVLFSKQHWDPPSFSILTSRQPIAGNAKLEINLDTKKLDQDKLMNWAEQFGIDKVSSEELASLFSKIPTNFEAFSLVCHCISLLSTGTNISVTGEDLHSMISSLHQQLPKEFRGDLESMGYPDLDTLHKLQQITLTVFSASNRLNQHSVDLFARLSPTHALPLSTLIAYLQFPFYELQEQLKERKGSVNESDNGSELRDLDVKPESEMGYWEFIKHTWKKRKEMMELLKRQQQQQNTINRVEMPTALQVLKESPLFRWEQDPSNGFESVKFCSDELNSLARKLFQQRTIPQMEERTVNRARSLHASSLLSKLSTFNPSLHLLKYRAGLPGVSKSAGVSESNSVHTLSLLHRIAHALTKDFENEGEQAKHRLISQHGDHLLRENVPIASEDRIRVMRLRAARLRQEDDVTSAVRVLREVASTQESNTATPLVELAKTYKELGELSLLQTHTKTGHAYYEQAANLYERAINKLTAPQQVEYGTLLYKYGVEMSYEKKLDVSKTCLEKSLALLNVAAAQTTFSLGQIRIQTLVLSSMVELAHVYIALGAHTYADKLLNMADNMGKTMGNSRDNPDLAQLYNLKALLKSLSGDKQGYVSLKQQAGDVLTTAEGKPFVY